jgi:hypothetical protein
MRGRRRSRRDAAGTEGGRIVDESDEERRQRERRDIAPHYEIHLGSAIHEDQRQGDRRRLEEGKDGLIAAMVERAQRDEGYLSEIVGRYVGLLSPNEAETERKRLA